MAVFYSSLFSIWETCCDVAVHYTLYIYLCNTGEKHASDRCLIFHQLQPVTFVFKQSFSYHLSWEQGTLSEEPVFFEGNSPLLAYNKNLELRIRLEKVRVS